MQRAGEGELEVATLVFDATKPISAPGIAAGSAVTSYLKDRRYKHTIQYMPGQRHFRITFHEGGSPRDTFYVPEARVSHWFKLGD